MGHGSKPAAPSRGSEALNDPTTKGQKECLLQAPPPQEFWSAHCPQDTTLPNEGIISGLLSSASFPSLLQWSLLCPQAPVNSLFHSAVALARVLSPQAPVHSTERGCWVFPYSPWYPGPSHPPSACPGTPHWVSLSPFTSFPINTGPGSQPPAQPLGGNGPESMAKG